MEEEDREFSCQMIHQQMLLESLRKLPGLISSPLLNVQMQHAEMSCL